jgi:hypothetical protein
MFIIKGKRKTDVFELNFNDGDHVHNKLADHTIYIVYTLYKTDNIQINGCYFRTHELNHSHTVRNSLRYVVRIRVRGSPLLKNSVRKGVYRVGTLGFVVSLNLIISILLITKLFN